MAIGNNAAKSLNFPRFSRAMTRTTTESCRAKFLPVYTHAPIQSSALQFIPFGSRLRDRLSLPPTWRQGSFRQDETTPRSPAKNGGLSGTPLGTSFRSIRQTNRNHFGRWPQCEKIGIDPFPLRSRATDRGGYLDPLARHSRSRSGAGTGAWPDSGHQRIAGRGCSSRRPQPL